MLPEQAPSPQGGGSVYEHDRALAARARLAAWAVEPVVAIFTAAEMRDMTAEEYWRAQADTAERQELSCQLAAEAS